jgi:hypothetical protein
MKSRWFGGGVFRLRNATILYIYMYMCGSMAVWGSKGCKTVTALQKRRSIMEHSWTLYEPDLKSKKSKVIPVTSRGFPLSCETLRIPNFLNNRLRDGGEIVSLTSWPRFDSQGRFLVLISVSLSQPQGQKIYESVYTRELKYILVPLLN